MTIEKIDIHDRWTNEIQFTAEIDCDPSAPLAMKLGLAVKWAVKNRARLVGASLDGASLDGASLDGARLDGASLDGARLDGASLDGASLVGASLVGASLVGASLVGASLDGARLDGASLDGARLDGASLDGASLVGASLVGASLDGASLVGASLVGASLVGASSVLRPIKADFWMILALALREVPALISALRSGRVNGSTYTGDCACLVGTLQKAGSTGLPREPGSAAERWFAPIQPGDRPEGEGEGPFRARIALEWAVEFCAIHGIDPEGATALPAEAA